MKLHKIFIEMILHRSNSKIESIKSYIKNVGKKIKKNHLINYTINKYLCK